MSKITILTGLIRSGKTTALRQWIEKQKKAFGVLTPDIENKRTFVHYPDRKQYDMICSADAPDAVQIGRYHFHAKSFVTMNRLLLEDFNDPNCECLVIDEIGPLELKGKGLGRSVDQIMARRKEREVHLVLIVRKSLVHHVIDFYQLEEYEVLEKEDLENL